MKPSFAGRDAELRRLLDAFAHSQRSASRVVFVAGEAGAGKSSLIEAFTLAAQKANPDVAVAMGLCDSNTGLGDPYLPFFGIVQQLAGHTETAKKKTASEASQNRLRRIAKVSTDLLVQYAPDLIGTVIPGSSLVIGVARKAAESAGLLDRLQQRFDAAEAGTVAVDQQRIMESYTALLRELSKSVPLVLVLDDLHWADAASCALLFHLVQHLKDSRIMFLGTYRSNDLRLGRTGGRHPMAQVINELKRYHGDIIIDLDGADETQRRAFVSSIIDSVPNELGMGFREALYRHTRGHALVTIEVFRALQERGDLTQTANGAWVVNSSINWTVLPSRVEGIIQERIGRLKNEVRDLLRVAAVEGEIFTVEILSRVANMAERLLLRTLVEDLDKRHQLVAEGEVEKIGANWISHYNFTHVLFQQYLYEQISARERMLLHRSIAEAMEELYAGQIELVTVALAHHYRLAGDAPRAFDYTMQVARRAMRMGASQEVLTHTDAALTLLADLPESVRGTSEFNVQLLRGHAFRILQGWDGPDVMKAYQRARVLLEDMPPDAKTYTKLTVVVLFGLWSAHLMHLQLRESETEAKDLLLMSEKIEMIASDILEDADKHELHVARMYAHGALGLTYFWMGRLAEATEHARRSLAMIDPELAPRYILQLGSDPRAINLRTLIMCETVAGRLDAVAELRRELARVLDELKHPFSIAITENVAFLVPFLLRDPETTLTEAQRAMERLGDKGGTYYRVLPCIFIAWAEAILGGTSGPAQIDEAFRAANVNGGLMYHSAYKLMVADAYVARGAWNDALGAIDAGIECAESHSELVFIAELHRTRGDVLRYMGRLDEAKKSYERALGIAREQGAGLFERSARESLRDLEVPAS